MALFARRPKPGSESEPAGGAQGSVASDATAAAPQDGDAAVPQAGDAPVPPAGDTTVPPTPDVGISMSSFGGLGATAPAGGLSAAPSARPQQQPELRPGPAEAPPPETVGGIPENVLLREAVATFAEQPDPTRLMNVARQLLQGQVYLRVKGDARSLLTEGQGLPFAVANRGNDQFAVVFSGGRALAEAVHADGATDTSAFGQPTLAMLRHVLAGSYTGVVIDSAAGRTSPVLPRALLQTALDEADPDSTIKNLLVMPRTAATAPAVANALTEKRVWIAVNRAAGSGALGVGESRSADGVRHLNLFSHPLEVIAVGRGDKPAPITPAQLAAALIGDAGLSGVIVDPAGPWIRLGRDDLAPVTSLAAAS